jgi:hypothetical protein
LLVEQHLKNIPLVFVIEEVVFWVEAVLAAEVAAAVAAVSEEAAVAVVGHSAPVVLLEAALPEEAADPSADLSAVDSGDHPEEKVVLAVLFSPHDRFIADRWVAAVRFIAAAVADVPARDAPR